jgi:hypothetical protein
VESNAMDLGWPDSRQWADVKGDGTKAYCRLVGNYTQLRCAEINKVTGQFDVEIGTAYLDGGWADSRWWADVNGDGKADYCRAVGLVNQQILCTVSYGDSFGGDVATPFMDLGWPDSRAMVDINGDGYADYCRLIGNNTKVSCIINDRLNFKTSIDNATDYTVDGGWSSVANGNRDWLAANGGQTGMYCRSVDTKAVKCDEIF